MKYGVQHFICHYSAQICQNSLRYCLIKQLKREKCSFLITDKVHTHSYQGYKIYLKHNAIDHYNVDCNIFECYVCQEFNPKNINSSIIWYRLHFVLYYFVCDSNLIISNFMCYTVSVLFYGTHCIFAPFL